MKILKVTLIPLALIFSLESYSQNEGNVPDSVEFEVLKELYTSLYGENWIDNTGWPDSGNWPASATADEMNTWYGIGVQNYDIVEIDLSGNNLTGSIPESIGNLTSLRNLILNNNLISDPLPDSLSSCTKLYVLNLADNIITGEIPLSWSQLISLNSFYIMRNGISGLFPAAISGMTNLEHLFIYRNQLEGEIADLSVLPKIVNIYIDNNKLSGSIPITLFENPNLINLNISHNQLTGPIPLEIEKAANLRAFDASHNQLTLLPSTINNCLNLETLQLKVNKLEGILPSLSSLDKLKNLYLHNNQLTGDPFNVIKNCKSLENLYLSSNQFSGEIPSYIEQFLNLKILHLSFNNFTGNLPDSIGKLIHLEEFGVRNSGLSGHVPEVFENLIKLRNLDLSLNKFEGNLPTSVCGLPLQHVDYDGNTFTGDIPECYGNFSSLRNFLIHNNLKITGSIPTNFKNLPNLELIFASATGIISIPELKNHPNKQNLSIYVSNSKLSPASIEKNLDSVNNHSFKTFNFGSQRYGGEIYYEVDINDSLLIEAIPGGVNATYTWEKYDSVNSVYVDVTNLNESSDPGKFFLATPDFGHYKVTIENSWIPQNFNSGPIIVNPYTGNTIYAIKSGDWHDPSLWSATDNGSSLNALPRNKDSVIIKGHVVNVLQSTSYYDAALLQDSLNETGLVVRSGTMTVTGNIRLRRESYPSPVYFQVVEQGNVEVLE